MICKWDEGFTIAEMLEETGLCKVCKNDCPNAGKSFKEKYNDEHYQITSIDFVPICSNCGNQILDTVDVVEDRPYSDKYPIRKERIAPSVCKKCGRPFVCIRMPARFPFDGYNIKSGEA